MLSNRDVVAFLFFLCLPLHFLASHGHAHNMQSAFLECVEKKDGMVQVFWKKTVKAPHIQPLFPSTCLVQKQTKVHATQQIFLLFCKDGLEGKSFGARGLGTILSEVILSVRLQNKKQYNAVLTHSKPQYIIPTKKAFWNSFSDFFWLGILHTWMGWDHILFMLSLVFLIQGYRTLFAVVTVFTLAHSMTLVLATLDWIRFSSPWIECMIALSLVFSAKEMLNPKRNGKPFVLALVFGWFHGLGFSNSLRSMGLSDEAIGSSLLGFNLGVEVAQCFVVLAGLVLLTFFRAKQKESFFRLLSSYCIGSFGSYFFLSRFFSGGCF